MNEELSLREQELLAKIKKGKPIGLSGEKLNGFPNLTLDTTEEDINKMIDEFILKYCSEQGVDTKSPEFPQLNEAMHLIDKLLINYYLEGLKESEYEKWRGEHNA